MNKQEIYKIGVDIVSAKNIQCDEFWINCWNGDSECFSDCDDNSSKEIVALMPSICERCVYNKKYENLTYNEFEDLRHKWKEEDWLEL